MTDSICPNSGGLRALLVDLDDTVLTDDAVSEKTWRAVCQEFAPSLGGLTADALYATIRNVADRYWGEQENHRKGRLDLVATRRAIVRTALREVGIHDDALAGRIADTYSAEKESAVAPVPGAIEALRYFKNIGLRLALLTNGGSHPQRRKIGRFGLDSLFDLVLIEGELGVGKPHPRIFETAMGCLRVDPSATWMVGDDLERDIAGAQGLGICAIWVDWRGCGLPSSSMVRPDRIVGNLNQLPDLYVASRSRAS